LWKKKNNKQTKKKRGTHYPSDQSETLLNCQGNLIAYLQQEILFAKGFFSSTISGWEAPCFDLKLFLPLWKKDEMKKGIALQEGVESATRARVTTEDTHFFVFGRGG
jgi:hypothetical protein